MKRLNSFSVLLFTFILLFLTLNLSVASFALEAFEIPYQINNSDRIVIGTVSTVDMSSDHTIVTVKVNEWLYNSLPTETIKVRTERGINIRTEVEAELIQNESVLLMLNDTDIDTQLFRVGLGVPGKHPVSDRDEVIKELKYQGKWKEEDQTGNKTNETETINNIEVTDNHKENITENKTVNIGKEENTGAVDKQKASSNSTQKLNSSPFISSFWLFAIVFGTLKYIRQMK